MFYNSSELEPYRAAQLTRQAARNEQDKIDSMNYTNKFLERKEIEKKNKIKYESFLQETKDVLVTEGIFFFVNNALPSKISLEQRKLAEGMVYNFVKENGSNSLLRKWSTNTQLLAELANTINTTYNKIVNETECKKDKLYDYTIKKSSSDEFYSKLTGLKNDAVDKKIAERVQKATTDFIEQQVQDKQRIEDMATKTNEKVNDIKKTNTDKKEELTQESMDLYKRETQDMRLKRPRNLFEEMVYTISNKALKDKSLLESKFTTNDGRFGVDAIIENTVVIYTVLETFNTIKIKEFKSEDVKSILQSL